MSSSPLIPILISVACLALSLAVVVPVIGMLKRRAGERLRAELGGVPVLRSDPMALYFGVKSQGVGLRGNGALMLTADRLGFMMLIGKKQPLIIPRASITKVESVRSHMGKAIGRPLLAVHFTNDAGAADVVGWYVRDLDGWLSALTRA